MAKNLNLNRSRAPGSGCVDFDVSARNKMAIVYPKDLLQSGYKRIRGGSCFVLMPFAEEFDGVYRVIFETLQSPKLNLVCQRADDICKPNILETILGSIAQAEFIIADLTGANPNVFYELGIAHSHKEAKNVILLSQGMEHVPFDLRHLRCIMYKQSDHGLEALSKELLATFAEASREVFRFRVHEGKRFTLGRKLAGWSNDLYALEIDCPMFGHGAIKVMIHYTRHSLGQDPQSLDSQFLFLTNDNPSAETDHIPWSLSLVEMFDRDAILMLQRGR